MKRFFDFPPTLLQYFEQIDRRFPVGADFSCVPAQIAEKSADLSSIRAVLWDVYGTLCGVELGDLEKTLEYNDRLLTSAKATAEEFGLVRSLERLEPNQPAEQTLRDLYKQLIDDSHLRSLATGVEYPEVLIEQIWLQILQDCSEEGLEFSQDEPPLHMAYRMAYFFDMSLQKIYLYPHVVSTLEAIKQAGIIQGIISNAQFYTPIHLRRLLRAETKDDSAELEDYFSEPLVFFSYELGFSKPNPMAFHRAIKFLRHQGIAGDEILYIGNDMMKDVWTASHCGIRTVLFGGDSCQTVLREDEPLCRDLQPDVVVSEMRKIADLIIENVRG